MAPTTIRDLPDDALHEIFGHVFAAESKTIGNNVVSATDPPEGAHEALRCVCRRWRDIADWVRLATTQICVDAAALANAGAVRARHAAAFKKLFLSYPLGRHSTSASRAAASLFTNNPDLQRALAGLMCDLCCLPAILPAVTPVAACTALTQLFLVWHAHKKRERRVVPSNMLAPLSALQMLDTLALKHTPDGEVLPESALAPLPALPDAPRLTALILHMTGNFVPVGSDAALGRLRKLVLRQAAPEQKLVDAEDPFLLRAAFDAGTWQPSRLTGLQELGLGLGPVHDSRVPGRPRNRSRSGSEWAPLAGQVTSLTLGVESDGYKRPSTGIVAGLGVLTALRELRVRADCRRARPGLLELMSLGRVRAPHLTYLWCDCVTTPVNVAQCPNLDHLCLVSISRHPPLTLRSLVARSTLKTLKLFVTYFSAPVYINLAELFVGGAGWPVLEDVALLNIMLEWNTTGLPGALTAAEFEEQARQLLPALVHVKIHETPGALPDQSRAAFVEACRRHVVPALEGLGGGGN